MIDGVVSGREAGAIAQAETSEALLEHYVRRVRAIDAELKAAEVQLGHANAALAAAKEANRARDEAIERLEATSAELQGHIALIGAHLSESERRSTELDARVREMGDAWSWRIGQRVVSLARPIKALLGPAHRRVQHRREARRVEADRARRMQLSEPDQVLAAYQSATAAGTPLETVMTIIGPDVYRSGAGRIEEEDACTSLWRKLATSRLDGPRLLDASELRLLDVFLGDERHDWANPLSQILALQADADHPSGRRRATALVVDARALQIPTWNGIKTHSTHVLEAVRARVAGPHRMLFLTTPSLPPLEPALASLGDGIFEPGDLDDVGAFLQMAPFHLTAEPASLELFRAPWIKRAAIFFDAIFGLYPHVWLTGADTFFRFQLGVEKLSRYDRVLALSDSAASEALDILGHRSKILVTGCKSSIGRATSAPTCAPTLQAVGVDDYVLTTGNDLAHKNLAAAVAGFASVAARSPADLALVVLASIRPDQIEALKELAVSLGLEAHRLVFLSQVPTEELARLYSHAKATVVPSFHEGFSLPVLESIGAGTPVVLSDIPAHRELLSKGDWFFPPADPAALAQSLQGLIAAPEEVLREQQSLLTHRFEGDVLDSTVGEVVDYLLTPPADLGAAPEAEQVESAIEAPRGGPASGPLSLSKVCELEDFSNPRLEPVIREVFSHELVRFGDRFPRGHEWRKYWEVAMSILTFKECGLLDGSGEFLGIGAGNEPTIFYLTRHARQVIATDLYLEEGWGESADSSMLRNPERHWPFAWNPSRLVVRHMNALDLHLESSSIDAIFSSSSVEHFGQRKDVSRSLDEAFRILRPGGVLSVSTEFRLRGERPGVPGVLMFDEDDVSELFIGDRDWALVEGFDARVSAATLGTAADFLTVAADQQRQVERLGGLWTHHVEYERYPHIVLSFPNHTFTSFHLALRKTR